MQVGERKSICEGKEKKKKKKTWPVLAWPTGMFVFQK